MRIKDFNRMIPKLKAAIELEVQHALHLSGEMIAERAKSKIGHQQSGWADLAEKTIEKKTKKGIGTPNPLLETGKLRDSIKAVTVGNRSVIGSDDKVAEYMEGGTGHVPPRPFLLPSAIEMTPEIEVAFMDAIKRAFTLK